MSKKKFKALKWAQLSKEQRAYRKFSEAKCGYDVKGDKYKQRKRNRYNQLSKVWIELHKEQQAAQVPLRGPCGVG